MADEIKSETDRIKELEAKLAARDDLLRRVLKLARNIKKDMRVNLREAESGRFTAVSLRGYKELIRSIEASAKSLVAVIKTETGIGVKNHEGRRNHV